MAWLGNWANRIEIDIDYIGGIGGNATWFPIAIIIESGLAGVGDKDVSCIFDELQSDDNRFKIAVTKADETTQLYVEIEHWDDPGENAVLHISRDGWALTADTSVFIYYDSLQADNTSYVGDVGSRTEVWDGDFRSVYHLANWNWEAYKFAEGVYTGVLAESYQCIEPNVIKRGSDWHMWTHSLAVDQSYHWCNDGEGFARQGTVTGGNFLHARFYYNEDEDSTDMAGACAKDGAAYTDETAAANSDAVNDMALLPATLAVGDAYYFGGDAEVNKFKLNVYSAGEGTYTITYKYWDGAAWTALAAVVDNTNGFKTAGINTIGYTMPADWATTNQGGDLPATCYWVKAEVTAYTPDGYVQPKGTRAYTIYDYWALGASAEGEAMDLHVGGTEMVFALNTAAVVPKGAGGEWDDYGIANAFMWKENGSWKMMYEGSDTDWAGWWRQGYATAAAGFPLSPTSFTKDGGNPVEVTGWLGANTYHGVGHLHVTKIGSTYYALCHTGGPKHTLLYLGDIYLLSSTNLTSWEVVGGPFDTFIARTLQWEGAGASGVDVPNMGSAADPSFIVYGGYIYVYYDGFFGIVDVAQKGRVGLVKIPLTLEECFVNRTSSMIDSTGNVDPNAHVNPFPISGRIGNTREFNGANSYIRHADDANHDFGIDDFTLEAWAARDVTGVFELIWYKRDSVAAKLYGMGIKDTNHVWCTIGGGGFTSDGTIEDNALHHIVCTFDRDSNGLVYIDGAVSGAGADISGQAGDMNNDGASFIGSYATGSTPSGALWWDGTIDEVRLSQELRSPAWIKGTYNSGNDSLLTYGDEEEYTPGGGGGLAQAALLLLG